MTTLYNTPEREAGFIKRRLASWSGKYAALVASLKDDQVKLLNMLLTEQPQLCRDLGDFTTQHQRDPSATTLRAIHQQLTAKPLFTVMDEVRAGLKKGEFPDMEKALHDDGRWLQPGIDFADWSDVTSLDELKEKQVEFIKGRSQSTPYHAGPLHVDSQELQDQLVTLNNLGFFTVDGQGKLFEEYDYCDGAEVPYQHRKIGQSGQMPYVLGHLPIDWVDRLQALLDEKPFIKYIFEFYGEEEEEEEEEEEQEEKDWCKSNFTGGIDVTVGRTFRKNASYAVPEQSEWKGTGHVCPGDSQASVRDLFSDKRDLEWSSLPLAEKMRKHYCYASFVIDDFDTKEILEAHLIEAITALGLSDEGVLSS